MSLATRVSSSTALCALDRRQHHGALLRRRGLNFLCDRGEFATDLALLCRVPCGAGGGKLAEQRAPRLHALVSGLRIEEGAERSLVLIHAHRPTQAWRSRRRRAR